ncbi:extracellular solute-binding protein [Swingsia samuiensis]|uniref:Extracellular solute-binding protein n=1 Tax=Swingsia samuiensis TaxID=1293412 RepID=A0A4Y6UK33_9PROT|nr:extracellular solute-binding protein [Swingsia samuiensis]QDH17160.1 extracellular solute-binding protein [Swingsia samuiensis]
MFVSILCAQLIPNTPFSGQAAQTTSSQNLISFVTAHIAPLILAPSALAAPASHMHKHAKKKKHLPKPHRSSATYLTKLGWAVPQGTIASSALQTPVTSLKLVEWDEQIDTLMSATNAEKPKWAAVLLNGYQLKLACNNGWIQSLNIDNESTTCGVTGGTSDLALAWDRSHLESPPNWVDFWNVARLPGRRGLHLGARTTLEIALLADGVDPQDIYTALSTEAGVQRAFHQLDLLRPYIVWWKTPADAANIMAQSSALMTSAPMTEIASVSTKVKAGLASSIFIAQHNNILRTEMFWAIPKNVPLHIAQKTLGDLRSINPHIDDVINENVNSHDTILPINESFWAEHSDELEKQFQTWYKNGRL